MPRVSMPETLRDETRGIASLLAQNKSGIDLHCEADWQINF